MTGFQGNDNKRDLILVRLETWYVPDDVVIHLFAGLNVKLLVERILKTYCVLSAKRCSSMNNSIRLGEENGPYDFTGADCLSIAHVLLPPHYQRAAI